MSYIFINVCMVHSYKKCIKFFDTEMHTLCMCVCVSQTPYSITDELLPAHDKSPPVCGISVVVHVGARPDPTAYALSPTT